jgi:hypothetical protein
LYARVRRGKSLPRGDRDERQQYRIDKTDDRDRETGEVVARPAYPDIEKRMKDSQSETGEEDDPFFRRHINFGNSPERADEKHRAPRDIRPSGPDPLWRGYVLPRVHLALKRTPKITLDLVFS